MTIERLYLTYEGLKLKLVKETAKSIQKFVSYLWGIETFWRWGGKKMTKEVCILPMRDWNSLIMSTNAVNAVSFVSYLWGIETSMIKIRKNMKQSVCILPMRDWNIFISQSLGRTRCAVCILPMRDWNSVCSNNSITWFWVCILPMRDWNSLNVLITLYFIFVRLYLTYEGLKLHLQVFDRDERFFVCILPMRDWNRLGVTEFPEELEFVSYLWGIETWGIHRQRSGRKMFVSYLWGIETSILVINFEFHICLYLTYEGLKLGSEIRKADKKPRVCILPMRDWNPDFQFGRVWLGRYVCILPMRDWNIISTTFFVITSIGLYLTYEGLKPVRNICVPWRLVSFVSYLWGIETR